MQFLSRPVANCHRETASKCNKGNARFPQARIAVENTRFADSLLIENMAPSVRIERQLGMLLEECLSAARTHDFQAPRLKTKEERPNPVTKTSLRLSLFAVSVAILSLCTSAHADAIYQVGGAFTCPQGSCLGGSYTLKFVGNNSGTTFDVTLTATTPNSTSGSPAFDDYVSSAEFGDGKAIASATLTTAPGGIGDWGNTVYGNLSNAGCQSGNAPNACNNQILVNGQYTQAIADGTTYSWTWHVVFSTAGLDLNENDMHIGLQYENKNDTSNGLIVSESGVSSHVPEPSTTAMLLSGLVGTGLWQRKRSSKKSLRP